MLTHAAISLIWATSHAFLWTGVLLVVAYLLYWRQKSLLMLAFMSFGCTSLTLVSLLPNGFLLLACQLIVGAATLCCLVLAIVNLRAEMADRLQRLHEEQRRREEAFAELQLALAQVKEGENAPPEKPSTPPPSWDVL